MPPSSFSSCASDVSRFENCVRSSVSSAAPPSTSNHSPFALYDDFVFLPSATGQSKYCEQLPWRLYAWSITFNSAPFSLTWHVVACACVHMHMHVHTVHVHCACVQCMCSACVQCMCTVQV